MTSISAIERSDNPPAGAPSIDARVMELLASRMCHDLISPVGAVHNGVEFLQEMGAGAGEEAVELIAHSAAQAAARLQIFRVVYGAGGRDGNIKPSDMQKMFGDLVDADGKVKQDWNPQALNIADRPAGFCKLLLGTMMLAHESLPKGGTIRIENGAGTQTLIAAEGPGAAARAQVAEALTRSLSPEDLDPRLVHPYILAVLAAQYGYNLTIGEQAENRVVYVLSC